VNGFNKIGASSRGLIEVLKANKNDCYLSF